MAQNDFPRVRGARARPEDSSLSLELGQVELDYDYSLPDGMDGSVRSRTSMRSGEEFDPALLTVQVYPGMRFLHLPRDLWLTVSGFMFLNLDASDRRDEDDSWTVEFEEDPPEDTPPEDPRYGMSARRFGTGLVKGLVVPESGVEDVPASRA